MSTKINLEIENCVRNKTQWSALPQSIKSVLRGNQKDYDRYVFNYSLKNQLRYRGNLVRKIFRNEQRYYELLVEKSINHLNLFPYHLADIVTKGLRVTPFNYYLDVICNLLKNDKSYDTLPNFTAADCLRVLGIGRNEYLALISELKNNSSKIFRKPNPMQFLPKFPQRISIEDWWKIEVGYVLESDIKYVNEMERSLIDDLIDFGSQTAGKCDHHVIHSLYRKGLIYLDVPVSGEDKICIPPLKNFVMNRVSGDYFENLLYKIFVSADEHMTMSELANMLLIDLDIVKQAVSLFCRLGFAKKKQRTDELPMNLHASWLNREILEKTNNRPQITPLNYHTLVVENENNTNINIPESNNSRGNSPNLLKNQTQQSNSKIEKDNNSIEYISSDGNISDFSFTNIHAQSIESLKSIPVKRENSENDISSEIEDLSENNANNKNAKTLEVLTPKTGKRVAFLFDSTLTAFLMMGNLSPGLKNHAVTMFEVGKLCDESIDTFLAELEKVSLLDAEGEGEVSRYFAHAVILRSTIIALRNILNGGLDLLRLECLESLDCKTRDRLLEKKYKFIISASPLSGVISHRFSIPFFGQFYKSSNNSHIWSKLFYYHISGYGPPSLLLTKGTVLNSLPRLFLGYGKLLVTLLHTEPYIICSENFTNINEQLKNGCVLVQGYGIRQPGEIRYEAFPFDKNDVNKKEWINHKAVAKLKEHLNMENTCGYITFVNTGVPDIGCENYEIDVVLQRPQKTKKKSIPGAACLSQDEPISNNSSNKNNCDKDIETPNLLTPVSPSIPELLSPLDSEVTSFNRTIKMKADNLKTPDENYFSVTPKNNSPSNVYRSDDCNELLAKELAQLDEVEKTLCEGRTKELVSQGSVEIPLNYAGDDLLNGSDKCDMEKLEDSGEPWTLLDVNFGVPLFDVDCNTRICEYLVRNLCTEENLSQLSAINSNMNEKFIKFVKQCLYFSDENIEVIKVGKLLPQPRINLAFENGKVCFWNRK